MFCKEFGYTPEQVRNLNFVDEKILMDGLIEAYGSDDDKGDEDDARSSFTETTADASLDRTPRGRSQESPFAPKERGIDLGSASLSDLAALGIQVETSEAEPRLED